MKNPQIPRLLACFLVPAAICAALLSCHTYSYSQTIYLTPKSAKVDVFYEILDNAIRGADVQKLEVSNDEGDPRRTYVFTMAGQEYRVSAFSRKNVLRLSCTDGSSPAGLLELIRKEMEAKGIKQEDVKIERIAYENPIF